MSRRTQACSHGYKVMIWQEGREGREGRKGRGQGRDGREGQEGGRAGGAGGREGRKGRKGGKGREGREGGKGRRGGTGGTGGRAGWAGRAGTAGGLCLPDFWRHSASGPDQPLEWRADAIQISFQLLEFLVRDVAETPRWCRQYQTSASDASAMLRKLRRARLCRLANPSTMLAGTEKAARRSCVASSNRSRSGKHSRVS